jgi:hypothetical protein
MLEMSELTEDHSELTEGHDVDRYGIHDDYPYGDEVWDAADRRELPEYGSEAYGSEAEAEANANATSATATNSAWTDISGGEMRAWQHASCILNFKR